MSSKRCSKCGEEVDEAKAFCPGCGKALIEEDKRTTVTEFDLSSETVKLGGTMYNKLLSDMGLSISKAPNKEPTVLEPVTPGPSAPTPDTVPGPRPARSRWLTRATIAVLGLLFFLVILMIAILFLLWLRFA